MSTVDLTRDLARSAILVGSDARHSRSWRRLRSSTPLIVERQDIWFESSPADRNAVSIRIRVHNRGDQVSAPAVLHVESAALGAFLPWRPLATVQLPSIAPAADHVVELQARAGSPGSAGTLVPMPLASGGPARPPTPGAPAPAEGGDGEERGRPAEWATASIARRARRMSRSDAPTLSGAVRWIASDSISAPEEAIRSGVYWAGNLNVWVEDGTPVERHMALGLRAMPGLPNRASFFVGSRRPDSYRFRFSGTHAGWSPELMHGSFGYWTYGGPEPKAGRVAIDEWLELRGTTVFGLQFHPPAGYAAGELIVHVDQRSTGREALVEFGFDPEAQGPGCYTV